MKDLIFSLSMNISDFLKPFKKDEAYFYFFLVLNGELTVAIDETVTTFDTNHFFTVQPNAIFAIIKESNAISHIFKISWEDLIDIIPNYDMIECNSKRYRSEHSSTLIGDYIKLLNSYNNEKDQMTVLTYSNLYKFLYSLSLFKVIDSQTINSSFFDGDKYKQRIKQIKKYLYQNYTNPVSLSDLADHLYITPQYTSSFITKHMNTTFQKLLTEIRINRAAKELIDTDLSVTKIAYNCGFSNIQYFNNAFKKYFITTPKLYRASHMSKKNDLPVSTKTSLQNEEIAHESLSSLEQDLNENKLLYLSNYEIQSDIKFQPISYSRRVWQEVINLGFASNLLSSTFQSHIQDVQNTLHFKYGRIQGISNTDVIDKISNTNRYNFSNFNRIIDFLYSINMIPFIEFGDKPQKLNIAIDQYLFISDRRHTEISNLEWDNYIKNFVSNCVNRYGVTEVLKWKFELWLQHDESLSYSEHQIKQYVDHYTILFDNIKNNVPGAHVGGFGFNAAGNKKVIKRVLSELALNHVKFDFFSFSSFHIIIDEISNIPLLTSAQDYLETTIEELNKEIHPYKLPLYLTEFTFDVTTRNYMHDSIFQAVYLLRNVIKNSGTLDTIAFWNLTDLSAEYKDVNRILFGGNGMVSIDGLRKPVYYAYLFLSYLGNTVIDEGPNYIVTSKGVGSYQILVFNYVHPSELSTYKYITDFQPQDVNSIFMNPKTMSYSFDIHISTPGNYRIKTYILNKNHGSVLDEWCRIGFDLPLETSEVNYLNNISVPKQDLGYVYTQDAISIVGSIHANEVKIYRIKLEL